MPGALVRSPSLQWDRHDSGRRANTIVSRLRCIDVAWAVTSRENEIIFEARSSCRLHPTPLRSRHGCLYRSPASPPPRSRHGCLYRTPAPRARYRAAYKPFACVPIPASVTRPMALISSSISIGLTNDSAKPARRYSSRSLAVP